MAPSPWPTRPRIYEINTWVWLNELGRALGRPTTLGDVPSREWDDLASLGIDAVWLMGVWTRSPAGIRIANAQSDLEAEFFRTLPDFTPQDNVGSAYCIRRYETDPHLGGPAGLAAARGELACRGLRLILDFVPNHVARDHSWVEERPEHFIQGSADDLRRAPGEFFESGGRVIACGRDPYFPPWTDVAQLNAFHPGQRRRAMDTATAIAAQCDGLRCDMAMLLVHRIFERTWGERAGAPPAEEYWREVIPAVRERHPGTLFLAEAYWDLEWELQQQGFDLCYDKRLYDRLLGESAESVRLHLSADLPYQAKLMRFLENHDEPRAASVFQPEKERAAAVAVSTLPGAVLFHEGQLEGRKIRVPVHLRRRPSEPPDRSLDVFYRKLFAAIGDEAIRQGKWRLCERGGWPDNSSWENVVAWCWRWREKRSLIVLNLSPAASQARVLVPWADLEGRSWRLTDELAGEVYDRDGSEMWEPGLYVDLPAWGFHFLTF